MKSKAITFFIFTFLMTTTMEAQPLQAVSNVDLTKYVGKWFEIATFPQRFQKRCHCFHKLDLQIFHPPTITFPTI